MDSDSKCDSNLKWLTLFKGWGGYDFLMFLKDALMLTKEEFKITGVKRAEFIWQGKWTHPPEKNNTLVCDCSMCMLFLVCPTDGVMALYRLQWVV